MFGYMQTAQQPLILTSESSIIYKYGKTTFLFSDNTPFSKNASNSRLPAPFL